jgi:hypothetical protein
MFPQRVETLRKKTHGIPLKYGLYQKTYKIQRICTVSLSEDWDTILEALRDTTNKGNTKTHHAQ